MDNSHPNAQLVQQVYDAFSRGDMDAVGAAYADEVSQHMPGNGSMSGDMEGKGAVFEWYGRIFELSNGTFWIKPESIVADDERGMLLYQAGAERNGQRREWSGVEVYAFRNGQIADIWTVPLDRPILDDFWN